MARDTGSREYGHVTGHLAAFEQMLSATTERLRLRERDILDCLTEREAAVCVRWAVGGLSPEQIGRRLGLQVKMVNDHLWRARRKLRAFVKSNAMRAGEVTGDSS